MKIVTLCRHQIYEKNIQYNMTYLINTTLLKVPHYALQSTDVKFYEPDISPHDKQQQPFDRHDIQSLQPTVVQFDPENTIVGNWDLSFTS